MPFCGSWNNYCPVDRSAIHLSYNRFQLFNSASHLLCILGENFSHFVLRIRIRVKYTISFPAHLCKYKAYVQSKYSILCILSIYISWEINVPEMSSLYLSDKPIFLLYSDCYIFYKNNFQYCFFICWNRNVLAGKKVCSVRKQPIQRAGELFPYSKKKIAYTNYTYKH